MTNSNFFEYGFLIAPIFGVLLIFLNSYFLKATLFLLQILLIFVFTNMYLNRDFVYPILLFSFISMILMLFGLIMDKITPIKHSIDFGVNILWFSAALFLSYKATSVSKKFEINLTAIHEQIITIAFNDIFILFISFFSMIVGIFLLMKAVNT